MFSSCASNSFESICKLVQGTLTVGQLPCGANCPKSDAKRHHCHKEKRFLPEVALVISNPECSPPGRCRQISFEGDPGFPGDLAW